MSIKRFFYKILETYIRNKYKMTSNELLNFMLRRDGIEVYKDNIEFLFLGSSNGELGVNTNMFDDNKAFNLCISSQDLYYSCELYKKYVKELKNLKNIFVTFSVFSSGFELQKTKNKRHIQYYKEVFNIPFKYETEWGGVELKNELKIIKYLTKKHYNLNKGFSGYTEKIPTFDINVAINDIKSHLKNAFRGTHQEEYLKIMNDIAKENNQNFYVIVLPRSPEYRKRLKEYAIQGGYDYDKIFNPMYKISEQYNIKIINHFDDENFTDKDFADFEHLLPAGAVKFTNILLKEIQ